MIDVESDQFEIERTTRRETRLGIALVEDETHCMTELLFADDVMLLMMMTAHRPASGPNDPRKRNDKHSFSNQCQRLTSDLHTQPLISSSSFLLLQLCPPCFGFFFLHVSSPFSSSFHRLSECVSSSHRFFVLLSDLFSIFPQFFILLLDALYFTHLMFLLFLSDSLFRKIFPHLSHSLD